MAGVGSDLEVIGGQPRMFGHMLSVAHVVSGIKELGIKAYGDKYFSQAGLLREYEKVRGLLDYCIEQKCVESVRPCIQCNKSNPANPIWCSVARELRLQYFGEGRRRFSIADVQGRDVLAIKV